MRILSLVIISILCLVSRLESSGAFPLDNPNQTTIGAQRSYTIKDRETLIEIAREFDIGYNEIVSANQGIDPWVPEKGTQIIIPTVWRLPEIMDEGILINLADMRLYFYFKINNRKFVRTFPLGIGRQGFSTPTGDFKITSKMKNPVWKVPELIRFENPELPEFVKPGPDNPLGKYWLELSVNGYGIHGTNRPFGIGRRISHGCIRLYPEDVEVLYRYVKPGTPVKIINKPVAQQSDK